MAKVHVVHVPFARLHPVTGQLVEYRKGDIIADPAMLDDIADTEHHAHGRSAELPDDHHAVFPHLPDDHPLKLAAAMPEAAKPARVAKPAADATA